MFGHVVVLLQSVTNSKQTQAKPILNRGEYEKLVDPRLGGAYDLTQLKRFSLAASLCIRESSLWRPTMTEVLDIMEDRYVDTERWTMPEEEAEEKDDFWGFEDLEYEWDSSFSFSPHNSM